MAQVEVKNLKNQVVETLELDASVFEYEASDTLVWEAVNAYRAARRKGTAATKGRSEVRGGGRKPWRQKGTGRARAGSIRSPLWRSGGAVHGPRPRSYAQKFPRQKRRGAVKRVLSDKLSDGLLVVIDDLSLPSHRTKEFVEVLKALGLDGKVLAVDGGGNRNLYLGSRNLPGVKAVSTSGVNIYDLLLHDALLISKEALLELQRVLALTGKARRAEAPGAGASQAEEALAGKAEKAAAGKAEAKPKAGKKPGKAKAKAEKKAEAKKAEAKKAEAKKAEAKKAGASKKGKAKAGQAKDSAKKAKAKPKVAKKAEPKAKKKEGGEKAEAKAGKKGGKAKAKGESGGKAEAKKKPSAAKGDAGKEEGSDE